MAKTRIVAGATWRQLTNKTGAASVIGTVVEASTAQDDAFTLAGVNAIDSFGVVAEAGIADGSECWVAVSGIAPVLLLDSTAATRDNWVSTSTTAGRADATSASPGSNTIHFRELGHCLQDVTAGVDKTARCLLHFN